MSGVQERTQNRTNSPERPVRVVTESGVVVGAADGEIARFLGIPYAEPPTGALRFRAPQPASPWKGELDATCFGAAAAQYFDPFEVDREEIGDSPKSDAPFVGDEDCLTLNVWAPAASQPDRPVIIWIHGGANWLESSRLSIYHGDAFAASGVVFVSLNYRLGPFGFLDLTVLSGADDGHKGSSSNGLKDQLMALEWIKANISAFGGDPENITLMGESAGSMDIGWLLTTGRLDHLVHRLVLMSGVASVPAYGHSKDSSPYRAEAGRTRARLFFEDLNIRSMSELQNLDTASLLGRLADAVPDRDMLFHWDSLFYPCIDGEFLKTDPLNWVAQGHSSNIDIVVGFTTYEMGLWLLWDPQLDKLTPAELSARLSWMPRNRQSALSEFYEQMPTGQPGSPGMTMLGDAMFAMPSLYLAEAHSRAGGKAWVYEFSWQIPQSPFLAAHAADLPFFFDTFQATGAIALIGKPLNASDEAERQSLKQSMHGALIEFASRSDPGENWPEYDVQSRSLMRFDVDCRVLNDPHAIRREWWGQQVYNQIVGP